MEHIENDDNYAGLSVNKGISQPPTVNPYLQKMRKPGAGCIRQENM